MERVDVMTVLLAKAAEVLEVEGLGEADSFVGRGADSLALVEWVMEVEDALGVELTETEVLGAGDLGSLADLIVAKQA